MAKAKKTVSVNFKGVEGKRALPPEDDYTLEVEEVEVKRKDKSSDPYFAFTFKITKTADGKKTKAAGAFIYDNASTSEKALWRLRSLLEALGVDVPDEEMDIDTDDLLGREMVGVIAHEKDPDYGTKAKLADFYALDGEAEEEEEEESSSSKKDKRAGKNKKKDAEEEAEEGEEEEEEAEEDDDARRRRRRKERRANRKGGDEEGEEESPRDKKDKKSDKKKPKKYTADAIQEMDEDDLEKVIEKTEVEVDLDDYKTLKKKQAALIDALEDAKLLEEDED